jgi:hypothetical protein
MTTNVQARLPAVSTTPLTPGLKAQATRIGHAVWDALHAIGAGRARKELIRLAEANANTNPELAAHLRSVVREDWLTKS